jgi:hypothetical protein
MSVSKIQAAISHPSLLTACQMALAVSSGLSKNLCALTDQETFGMKSQKKEALAHPGL